jgi:hypothetical protein
MGENGTRELADGGARELASNRAHSSSVHVQRSNMRKEFRFESGFGCVVEFVGGLRKNEW